MTMTGRLTAEQIEEVNAQYLKVSASILAAKYGVKRGCIIGHWGRYRHKHNLPPQKAESLTTERNQDIFRRYCDFEGPSKIALDLGLTPHAVESVIKRMRKKIGMAPHRRRASGGASIKKFRPDRKEIRVIGIDGRPLPFRARPVPAKEGVMPIPFEELDLLSLGDGVCRCRHYVGDAFKVPAMFCGDPTEPGRSYCRFHMMIAYRAVEAPKLDAEKRAELARTAKHFLTWREERSAPEQLREAA